MDRVLRDSGGSLTLLNYDSTGALGNVNAGAAPTTVTVTDSAGVSVPGFTCSTPSPAGTYTITIPNDLDVLDVYDILLVWGNTQSRRLQFELVGGFLFTAADLQGFANELSTLTVDKAKAYRNAVEDVFESPTVTGRAFRPRGRRLVRRGTGLDRITTGDADISRLVSATISGTALTSPELAAVTIDPLTWELVRTSGIWSWDPRPNVSLLYEYGLRAVPADVHLEALRFAKSLALTSPLEEGRATAVFTDIGGYRLTIPGRDGPTGIPSVDACLSRYSRVKAPGIA